MAAAAPVAQSIPNQAPSTTETQSREALSLARKVALASLIAIASLAFVLLCVFTSIVPAILFSAAIGTIAIAIAAALIHPYPIVVGSHPVRVYRPLILDDPIPPPVYFHRPLSPLYFPSWPLPRTVAPVRRDPHVRVGAGDVYAGRSQPFYRENGPSRPMNLS